MQEENRILCTRRQAGVSNLYWPSERRFGVPMQHNLLEKLEFVL
jgi:hypothetical protein